MPDEHYAPEPVPCPHCGGSGQLDFMVGCDECGGGGEVLEMRRVKPEPVSE